MRIRLVISKSRKTEQDKFSLKILTLGRPQHKIQLSWNWVICAISESQMTGQTPKLECTQKIDQNRSFLKISTFGQHLCKSQLLEIGRLHNFWASNEETGPKIEIYSKIWVGQVCFENFDFLVKVKGPLGQSIFFLSFFFLRRFGPGQVSRSVKPVSGGDVISDVIELEVSGGWRHQWRH